MNFCETSSINVVLHQEKQFLPLGGKKFGIYNFMQFKAITGQQSIKERLIQAIEEHRVSHAQLFVGPEGNGKLALALAFAQYINCRQPQEGDSCGVCPSCRKYEKLIHPDLHFVFPVVKKGAKRAVSDDFIRNWRELLLQTPYINIQQWFSLLDVENAQGMIYSEESEEIIRKLNLKSFEAEYKVMIVWLPERMNVSCSNKLLKMIEEPPPKTLFLLVSEDEEQIISTIRSRAQKVRIPRISKEDLREYVGTLPETSGRDVDILVHLSGGNRIALKNLLEQDDHLAWNLERFRELMRFSYGRKYLELMEWVDEVARSGRERQKSFLEYALRLVRENFISNLKKEDLIFMNSEERTFSNRFSPFINERNIIPLSNEFELASRDIRMNGNAKVILTDLTLKVVKMIRA